MKQLHKALGNWNKKIKKLELDLDYLENQSRRNNLRIDGIIEEPNESWDQTETIVRRVLTEKLQINVETVNKMQIERAHRIRQNTQDASRPRTIVVRLSSYKDRKEILKTARRTKPQWAHYVKATKYLRQDLVMM